MILIKNVDIYTPTRRISNGAILIKDGRIAYAGPLASIPAIIPPFFKEAMIPPFSTGGRGGITPRGRSSASPAEVLDFKGCTAVPGFIDIHLHGGAGSDFMDGTEAACLNVLKAHLKKGTTSAVPTLMTAAPEVILKAIKTINKVKTAVKGRAFGSPLARSLYPRASTAEVDPRAKPGALTRDINTRLSTAETDPQTKPGAPTAAPAAGDVLSAVLGLHLEGPFIAKEKRGAQPESHVRPYSAQELGRYIKAAGKELKIMTLAPEIFGANSLIRSLKRHRIIAAAGHSNASYAEASTGIGAGLRHGTHLFNAMSGLFHRDPGLAGALLLDDRVSVELIADGIHIHPAMVLLVTKIKPLDKIVLVTDATRKAGQSRIPLRTKEGRLFGSAITLDIALRNMLRWTSLPMTDVLPMLTLNPARLLGLSARKGRIAAGADADLVILDKTLKVKHVFVRGERVS
ncbi:MAG: N-acetylglucosamine-6-phosphate deacetylase [Candidatus Aminicenantes bacterium]|nr:N-acetylglucosamine-6-phosphate deacetylase [Candidatus Aminicenantes bacterium]